MSARQNQRQKEDGEAEERSLGSFSRDSVRCFCCWLQVDLIGGLVLLGRGA